MNPRASLILSLAALLGLSAPLCAYACLDARTAESVVADVQHSEQAPPCHGGAPASSEEAPAGEHECGCDDLQVVLTKSDSGKALDSLEVDATTPLRVSFRVLPLQTRPARLWTRRALPPPDILLLKSTLLI
jgi:hypothetical protein